MISLTYSWSCNPSVGYSIEWNQQSDFYGGCNPNAGTLARWLHWFTIEDVLVETLII